MGMESEAVKYFFENWKYPDNHKAKIREWIADVVNGNPIQEIHNKGFNLNNVNGFVAGGFNNCLVPLMRERIDVNVMFQMNQLKPDSFAIRMQVF